MRVGIDAGVRCTKNRFCVKHKRRKCLHSCSSVELKTQEQRKTTAKCDKNTNELPHSKTGRFFKANKLNNISN